MTGPLAADLHIHGTYSGATSDRMVFETIAKQANKKGLDFVGTGDILHPRWKKMLQEELEKVAEGTYRHPHHEVKFVLTVEVEDRNKVHHLILVPSLTKVEELRKKLDPYSSDMNIDGRPRLDLEAPEIVEMAIDSESFIGPSHAFTPWTSIYKEFNSLEECYKDQLKNVNFLELGLSADTSMADRIDELKKLTFLSNSDAHSPWPNKLGREFNRFDLPEPNSSALFEAVKRRKNIILNVGLDPRLGKYHLTACSRCHKKFRIEDAKSRNWNCDNCGGVIKKGVSDRVQELADYESPQHPNFRPDYLRTAPLSEIISLSFDRATPRSRKVQETWNSLIDNFNDEISVLIDVDVSEIESVTNQNIAAMVQAFRNGNLEISPGGGGEYGELKIPSKLIKARKIDGQKTLSDFGE